MNTSNSLSTFNFNSNEIRVVTIDDQPWFVAADVCKVLEIRNSRDAVNRLDEDEKGVANVYTLGGNQEMTVINESGLYSLILTSRKPEAKTFKKWVTGTVLPSIRKDGAYIMGEEKVVSGEMDEDEFILKAMTILQGKVERLKQENAKQAQVITEMKPAATVGAAVGTKQMSVYAFARNLHGVNAQSVKQSLAAAGYLYRAADGAYRVYAKYRTDVFIERQVQAGSRVVKDIFITPKGTEVITKMYREGRLVMLKAHQDAWKQVA